MNTKKTAEGISRAAEYLEGLTADKLSRLYEEHEMSALGLAAAETGVFEVSDSDEPEAQAMIGTASLEHHGLTEMLERYAALPYTLATTFSEAYRNHVVAAGQIVSGVTLPYLSYATSIAVRLPELQAPHLEDTDQLRRSIRSSLQYAEEALRVHDLSGAEDLSVRKNVVVFSRDEEDLCLAA